MGRFIRFALATTTIAAGYSTYAYQKIYDGDYFESSPYHKSQLSFPQRVLTTFTGSPDDIAQSKTQRLINPHKNEVSYDYFEKRLDAITTKRILAKYQTREEILGQLQNGVFLGPTLYFHRYVLSPYFKSLGDHNRIAGFTGLEPELKRLNVDQLPKTKKFEFPLLPNSDKIKYVWSGKEFKGLKTLLPHNTVIYGLFDLVNSGKRSNGGFFEFTFGSDLLPTSAIHRIDYFTVKDKNDDDNLVVRFTNASVWVPPNSPRFLDETNGLHELMTRTIVLDAIDGLTKSL